MLYHRGPEVTKAQEMCYLLTACFQFWAFWQLESPAGEEVIKVLERLI